MYPVHCINLNNRKRPWTNQQAEQRGSALFCVAINLFAVQGAFGLLPNPAYIFYSRRDCTLIYDAIVLSLPSTLTDRVV